MPPMSDGNLDTTAMSSLTPATAAVPTLRSPAALAACRRLAAAALAGLALLLATGCAALPGAVARQPSTAMTGTGTTLQRIADDSRAGQDPAHAGLRLLPNGDHALDARLALIRRAERSLDLQYYAWNDDDTGRQLLAALREAGQRGVRVRLLVDDLHAGAVQPLLAGLDAHAGIEVRLFNPLPVREGSVAGRVLGSLHDFDRINHRMHNKLFIADAALAVIGGRNIGDEYFMRSPVANFVDLDVLVAGPVVAEMAAVFDRYWNNDRAWPVQGLGGDILGAALRARFDEAVAAAPVGLDAEPRDRLGRTSVSAQLDAGRVELLAAPVRLLADAPDKQRCPGEDDATCASADPSTVDELHAAMRRARHELKITSPYFVPGASGMAMLQEVSSRGASIRLLTNSLGATDEPLVHWGYARYRPAMLELGVQIRELSPNLITRTHAFGSFGRSAARLHAKVVVIDGRWVALGSANMDQRSARLNTEMALLVDSPALAAELARLASAEALAGSYRLRLGDSGNVEWMVSDGDAEHALTDEPHLGWAQRLRLGLASLWIAEEQL
jgi:putative cardiolipin synthase